MTPFRTKFEYNALALFAWVIRWLPLKMSRAIADLLGWILANWIKLRRDVALDNLKQAFGSSMDATERQRIYVRCWRHFMRVGVEMARLPRMTPEFADRWVDLSGRAVLDNALSRGKGVMVVSGHFGNWEWMGGGLALSGLSSVYVVESQSNRLVEDWLNRMRQSVGVEIVPISKAARGLFTALRRNKVVAILCDQDAGDRGVFVPFFGRLASTPQGPALFHLRTGAPIVFAASPRDKKGVYRVIIEEMTFPNLTGDSDHDVEIIMSRITARLEAEIRRHPEQWLWLHRRWKSSDRRP
ncbi:MAG: lysophospholipid acyltransferase family protein [Candidatus Electryoneaceae bacterium]|nr:lysophospholipid acyltransferase family protein [Candidatus Electryoneaceae bacterium]